MAGCPFESSSDAEELYLIVLSVALLVQTSELNACNEEPYLTEAKLGNTVRLGKSVRSIPGRWHPGNVAWK